MLGTIIIGALLIGVTFIIFGATRWGGKLIAGALFLGLVLPFVALFGLALLAWLKEYAYLLWIIGGVLLTGGYLRFRARKARWHLHEPQASLKHRVERY